MLKIKKSYGTRGYIVYDPKNFDGCHTHVDHYRVAVSIRKNVNRFIIPRSRNRRTIKSHLRVTTNKIYRERLLEILYEIECEEMKEGEDINGKTN